jgi:hypothetical protein
VEAREGNVTENDTKFKAKVKLVTEENPPVVFSMSILKVEEIEDADVFCCQFIRKEGEQKDFVNLY